MTSNSKKVMCKFDCTPRRLSKDTCDIYSKRLLKKCVKHKFYQIWSISITIKNRYRDFNYYEKDTN